MYNRFLQLDKEVETSIFLFGARQTGKSTALRASFPDAIYIDLLDTEIASRYRRRPVILYEQLADKTAGTLVVIDEIAEVPALLNEVHRLMSEKDLRFVLCGSSARKLKRNGYNTLGGRAVPCYYYPLVSAEIPDFDIDRAVNNGLLPRHYLSDSPQRLLSAYIDVYLRQEIQAEAIVRNLRGFQRFLDVAALTNGEMVNYANIATDCGIAASTVKDYFSILEDTLIGYMIPAYTRQLKRKLVQAPRFYYFDVGVANHLLHRSKMVRGSVEYGHAFEHLVIQELIAYIGYTHSSQRLSYWRTYTGLEVDAVIGDADMAIEIKSSDAIALRHLKGLKAFGDEYPHSRCILVSFDRINRNVEGIELIYIRDFLSLLWNGGLF